MSRRQLLTEEQWARLLARRATNARSSGTKIPLASAKSTLQDARAARLTRCPVSGGHGGYLALGETILSRAIDWFTRHGKQSTTTKANKQKMTRILLGFLAAITMTSSAFADRKVVQIMQGPYSVERKMSLYVLCDDGTIWCVPSEDLGVRAKEPVKWIQITAPN
jgi:hypothetical protein